MGRKLASLKIGGILLKGLKELWKLLGFSVKAILQELERNFSSKSEFCNAELNEKDLEI